MVIPLGSWRRGAVLAVVGALSESDYIQSVGLELKFKIIVPKGTLLFKALLERQRTGGIIVWYGWFIWSVRGVRIF